MKKFFPVMLILVMAIFLAGCSGQNGTNKNDVPPAIDNSSTILFYGQECPHCQIVEEYIEKNNVESKFSFSRREVFHDKANAALMLQKAKSCNINTSKLGVPLVWSEGKCYEGQDEAIKFFEEKIKSESNKNQDATDIQAEKEPDLSAPSLDTNLK